MKYIKAPNGCVIKREGKSNTYYRDAGNWEGILDDDNVLTINSPHGVIKIPGWIEATREEWLEDNKGYVSESKDEQIEDLKEEIEKLKNEIPY